MDTIECINTRRSVRKYRKDLVPRTLVKQVMAAGMMAPSGVNSQPWHFTIVHRRETLSALEKCLADYASFLRRIKPLASIGVPSLRGKRGDRIIDKIDRAAPGFFGAPALVVVHGSKQSFPTWRLDCALALQNMVLAAHALGLGTCFVGAIALVSERTSTLHDVLRLPPDHEVIGSFTLGFPDGPPGQAPRRFSPEMRTSWI